MANTKTLTGNGIRGYYIEFYCNETGTDIATNTSTISYTLKIYSNNYSYAEYGTGYSIYINGTRVAYVADNGIDTSLSAHSSLLLKSGTTTVPHNNDGTKTVNLSASVSMPEGSYGPGDMSCSGTWTLTTIPRASSMTLPSSFTIGSSGSITVTMASNTFSHTITYSGYGLSGTVANLNAGVSSTSWTPPTSFYAKLPSSTSGTVTLTLTTKSGSTTIGTATYNATIVVPTSIKPTAPTVTLAPVNTNAWISSKGLYVGGYSAVKVTSSASPGSGASNTLTYTISGAFSGSGTPYTSGVLSAGAKSITVTATDSRGRTNSTTKSVTFLTYTYPGLTTFSAVRGTYSGGSWTSNVNGDHIRVQAVPSVALSSQGNTASVTVKIGNTSPSATSGNYYYFTGTNATTSYVITGSVSDSVGNSTSRSLTVPTIEVPFNINVDHPGAAFGMIAQKAHAFELAPAWSLMAYGKNNSFDYMPYSFNTVGASGQNGYVKIATINITAGWVYNLIHFRVVRLVDPLPINLYISFGGTASTDPSLSAFYHDGFVGTSSNIDAFAYKAGPSTWEVYVHNYAAGNNMTVYTYVSVTMQQRCNITYDDKLLTSKPSGAISAISCAPTGVYSGTCPTAGATAAKTATVNHGLYFPLEVGTTVSVVFSNSNTASPTSLTLNVNNTGAYGIRLVRNASIQTLPFTGGLIAGVAYLLSFSGSYWFVMNFDDFYYNDDYVTDRGTSGNWTYRKWSSGDAECWGSHPMSVSGWSAWGVLYETNGAQYTYPSGLFIAEPNYNATPRGSGGLMMEATGAGSATQTPKLYAVRPNAGGTDTIYWYIHARGRWK